MKRRTALQLTALLGTGFGFSAFAGEMPAAPRFRSDLNPDDDWLLLGANENPFGSSDGSQIRVREAMRQMHRYPNAVRQELRQQLAKRHNLAPENILLSAGSSEVLGLAALLCLQQGGELLTCAPTFRIWFDMASELGGSVKTLPLTGEKQFDLAALRAGIGPTTKLVYVCNPNNPTGTKVEHAALKTFVHEASARCTVLLDEVYHDYIDDPSLADMVADHPNLIIARSFSKIFGLAGMRIGYGIAHPDVVKRMEKRQPWAGNSASVLSMQAALGGLQDQGFIQKCLQKNQASLAITTAALTERNIRYIPSAGNFIFFSLDRFPADFIQKMEVQKVVVREVKDGTERWCRVSMGTPEEMNTFFKRLNLI